MEHQELRWWIWGLNTVTERKAVKGALTLQLSYFQWSRTWGALMTVKENGLRCGQSLEYPLKSNGRGRLMGFWERLGQETMNI